MDFTRPDLGQVDVAVMPAGLAKRLLKLLAKELEPASANMIALKHLEVLNLVRGDIISEKATLDDFVQANLDFVIERQLIDNVTKENWDAYKVEQPSDPNL